MPARARRFTHDFSRFFSIPRGVWHSLAQPALGRADSVVLLGPRRRALRVAVSKRRVASTDRSRGVYFLRDEPESWRGRLATSERRSARFAILRVSGRGPRRTAQSSPRVASQQSRRARLRRGFLGQTRVHLSQLPLDAHLMQSGALHPGCVIDLCRKPVGGPFFGPRRPARRDGLGRLWRVCASCAAAMAPRAL